MTLATQSYGSETVSRLANSYSLLLLHGTDDQVLPAYSSTIIFQLAPAPKKMIIYQGAGHELEEVSEDVHKTVYGWLTGQLL